MNAKASGGQFRPCVVIPTYDNPDTIRGVVEEVRAYLPDVVVIDDHSAEPGRLAVEELGRAGLAHVRRQPRNSGKGGGWPLLPRGAGREPGMSEAPTISGPNRGPRKPGPKAS